MGGWKDKRRLLEIAKGVHLYDARRTLEEIAIHGAMSDR